MLLRGVPHYTRSEITNLANILSDSLDRIVVLLSIIITMIKVGLLTIRTIWTVRTVRTIRTIYCVLVAIIWRIIQLWLLSVLIIKSPRTIVITILLEPGKFVEIRAFVSFNFFHFFILFILIFFLSIIIILTHLKIIIDKMFIL